MLWNTNNKKTPLTLFLLLCTLTLPIQARAEFVLNFLPNPNVVDTWANWSCIPGVDGGFMGGGSLGPGCGSDYFLQEVVNDNGVHYYHVILGDPNVDDFALEYYMRVGDCCWWDGAGMGGGMGAGPRAPAPFTASYGDLNDLLGSAWLPLSGPEITGNGTGNPSRIYLRQINNDAQMNQEFIKDIEANKPRILQVIQDYALTSTFDLDMRNGGHNAYTDPISFVNETAILGINPFDAASDTPNAKITAGRYIYYADNPIGAPHGDSYGSWDYEDGGFDIYAVDWLSYCHADQNPDLACNFVRGGAGGGGGGM